MRPGQKDDLDGRRLKLLGDFVNDTVQFWSPTGRNHQFKLRLLFSNPSKHPERTKDEDNSENNGDTSERTSENEGKRNQAHENAKHENRPVADYADPHPIHDLAAVGFGVVPRQCLHLARQGFPLSSLHLAYAMLAQTKAPIRLLI